MRGGGDICEVEKNKQTSNPRSSPIPIAIAVPNGSTAEPAELARNDDTLEQKFPRASDRAFKSLTSMNFSELVVSVKDIGKQNQQLLLADGKLISNSCSKSITREDSAGSYPSNGFTLQQTSSQRKLYPPHWPIEAVNEALKEGHVFKAVFRVNAHNRVEAYCKIEGVQTDVLVSGISAQNRAVEGDMVAVKIDHPSSWIRIKGLAGTLNTTSLDNSCKGKNKVEIVNECVNNSKNYSALPERGINSEVSTSTGSLQSCGHYTSSVQSSYSQVDRDLSLISSKVACHQNDSACSVEKLCAIVNSFPLKRPTGRIVSIIERSPRRDAVVGFLDIKQCLMREAFKKQNKKKNGLFHADGDYVMFIPNDPKFSKMMVFVRDLPSSIVKRLQKGDTTIENKLVGVCICGWGEENSVPHARMVQMFGRGGEIESHIAAILFENGVNTTEFSSEVLSSSPPLSWHIPLVELQNRIDLRNLCTFTIDPSTATDLDDALSVEKLPNGLSRVGVHIADVSYFVLPGTALDREAQIRSTSFYLSQGKIPMLPSLLSENVGSLNPEIDKLAFSIIWDLSQGGEIVNQWIGRTVIRSCCKLSYSNAQHIIDGKISETGKPQVHSNFEWSDVCKSVQSLFEISKTLKENRYNAGALCLNSSKFSFLLDDDGIPYESMLSETTNSNFLVEEFMLLANKSAAEVIFKAYPDSALLRMHPEPHMRKINEFGAFCIRHGLELDTSSSAQFHRSMEGFKKTLEHDPVLLNIVVNCATKCMQSAKYFSSGEIKDNVDDWGHYALGVPFYTHFTSPLRRYADIVVHRTLAASIEAEEIYFKLKRRGQKVKYQRESTRNCFTGICFDTVVAESPEGKAALSEAASRNGVPCTQELIDIAVHCNKRKLACRNVKDASDRLYKWCILKKEQILLTKARVLALGPRFMSIYIPRLDIERRINYDEVEDLAVEWLEVTSTLLLNLCNARKRSQRRGSPGNRKTLEEVALITCPFNLDFAEDFGDEGFENRSAVGETEPAAFPLTVSLLSTIPVALHAIGGDDGPIDIGARLYMSTYLR